MTIKETVNKLNSLVSLTSTKPKRTSTLRGPLSNQFYQKFPSSYPISRVHHLREPRVRHHPRKTPRRCRSSKRLQTRLYPHFTEAIIDAQRVGNKPILLYFITILKHLSISDCDTRKDHKLQTQSLTEKMIKAVAIEWRCNLFH